MFLAVERLVLTGLKYAARMLALDYAYASISFATRTLTGSGLISALKIHCSGECKAVLDKLGGYQLKPRGLVAMKVGIVTCARAIIP